MQNFSENKNRENATILLPDYSTTKEVTNGLLLGFNVSEFLVIVLDIVQVDKMEDYTKLRSLLDLQSVKNSFNHHFNRVPKILGSMIDLTKQTDPSKKGKFFEARIGGGNLFVYVANLNLEKQNQTVMLLQNIASISQFDLWVNLEYKESEEPDKNIIHFK